MLSIAEIIQLYLAIIGVASIIVKATPTLKDDLWLKKIVSFVGKFIALNRKQSLLLSWSD